MIKNTSSIENSEYLQVSQIKSPIGRNKSQRLVLIGLGLNKIDRTVKVKNTPAFRGMINKIHHLLKVESVSS